MPNNVIMLTYPGACYRYPLLCYAFASTGGRHEAEHRGSSVTLTAAVAGLRHMPLPPQVCVEQLRQRLQRAPGGATAAQRLNPQGQFPTPTQMWGCSPSRTARVCSARMTDDQLPCAGRPAPLLSGMTMGMHPGADAALPRSPRPLPASTPVQLSCPSSLPGCPEPGPSVSPAASEPGLSIPRLAGPLSPLF